MYPYDDMTEEEMVEKLECENADPTDAELTLLRQMDHLTTALEQTRALLAELRDVKPWGDTTSIMKMVADRHKAKMIFDELKRSHG